MTEKHYRQKTRRERFLTVAPRRTQKACEAIRAVGRCAEKVSYKYEVDEAKQIIAAIESEVRRLRASFDLAKKRFRFKEPKT